METQFKERELNLDLKPKKRYDISPIRKQIEESEINFMIKDHREKLISKRKEFIKNYRKKQRLLSQLESSKKKEKNNINMNKISIEYIKNLEDPVSRIIYLRNYFFSDNSIIDINFIKNNFIFLKDCFKNYNKYLFDYENKNISAQIKLNKYIIYSILLLLFEPESNPIINEIDFEFMSNINNFCFFYLKLNDNIIKENITFYLYILFLLNNLVSIYPDEELMKACINFKSIIKLYIDIFFPFSKTNNNNDNIYELDLFDLLEFSFLKLMENCINKMNLYDRDLEELYENILSLIYYNFYNNEQKLLIYGLECLTRVNNSYEFLMENISYNKFLLTAVDEIIINFKNNSNINNEFFLIKAKLILELYLRKLYYFLNDNNENEIITDNANLFLKEDFFLFFKNCLYYFSSFEDQNKQINQYELKIIIKLLKIIDLIFKILVKNIYSKIDDKFIKSIEKIFCSYFINEINSSLYNIIMNIFFYFVKSEDKSSNKICNLIIKIFNSIYPLKELNLTKSDSDLLQLQLNLIERINIHRKILIYLNLENYPFLSKNLLDLANKILVFTEQYDIHSNNKNCILDRIKKDLKELNVFYEIENIEVDGDINLRLVAEAINNQYFRVLTDIN